MKHLFAPAALFLLAGCAAGTSGTVPVDSAKALYFLEAAGCITNAAAAAAAPVVQATSDAQGNAVLAIVGGLSGIACKISVPAAAVAPTA